MRPIIAAAGGHSGELTAVQWRFRHLRDLAIKAAFRCLSAYRRPSATYLRRLFGLRGPGKYSSAIATLNFDVTVEQLASISGLTLRDGFACERVGTDILPPEWNTPGLET